MHINTLADKLRAVMPAPLWELFRKLANALLGPLHFSLETGHLRSCLYSRAMDRYGSPLPWFTYPAIQFLCAKNFAHRSILEWGAGQSTRFWASRAESVTAIEGDEKWFKALKNDLPSNVKLHLVKLDLSDVPPGVIEKKFDIVVCDGLDRFLCAQKSINLLKEGGAIIIDNSDGNQGTRPGFGFIELYRDAGFSRIDFYGYPPGNTVQQCTSVFFKADCFLFRGEERPWPPLSFWVYPPEIMEDWQKPSVSSPRKD
ncbi:MAG: class I SAM-dependent methyltransferase [Verrucomicrobia bacterium]|nr:class I SAM-dependent methyltransferase [Verrucomicrobiota bacterium]